MHTRTANGRLRAKQVVALPDRHGAILTCYSEMADSI